MKEGHKVIDWWCGNDSTQIAAVISFAIEVINND
jgi:hypothetical protein